MTKQELINNIKSSFQFVKLEDGIGLWEAQGIDDFDTQVQSEELSNMEDESAVELALGQDDEGNFYVMDVDDQDNPKIVFKTK